MVGLLFPAKKQWAAVKTQSLLIKVPPQRRLSLSSDPGTPKAAAHGHALRVAASPPTTLVLSGIPQDVSGF